MMETRVCPVCKNENPYLSIVCGACGSYLRESVRSLDLFQTVWNLVESPHETLQRIVIANQKNYSWLLQVLFGCTYVSFLFWGMKIGIVINDLILILVLIMVIGPVIGIMVINMIALIGKICIGSSIIRFRDIRALLSYSSMPLIISFLILFPVEVGIFGMYLFTESPSPMLLKPVIYIFLLVLDGLLIGWTLFLFGTGMRVVGLSTGKNLVFIFFTTLLLSSPVLITTLYRALSGENQ
jgi:hypothetical protein